MITEYDHNTGAKDCQNILTFFLVLPLPQDQSQAIISQMNLQKYVEYTRCYTGNPLWPLAILQRKPIFRRTSREVSQLLANGLVLDVGTGPGYLPVEIAHKCRSVEVVGIDISLDLIRDAAKRCKERKMANKLSFMVASVESLPFADNAFDMVQSTFSWHLWYDQFRGLKEIHRVLKPTSQAIILVSRRFSCHRRANNQPINEIKNMCLKAGFNEIRIENDKDIRGLLRILLTT